MRLLDEVDGPTPESLVEAHVALPVARPTDRALVRLGMISSVDGGSAIAGVSGGLGNQDDHAVFRALRENADAVIVGLGTAVAEHYRAPTSEHLHVYVVADRVDLTGAESLFERGRTTLVVPDDAGPALDGVPTRRGGANGQVDVDMLSRSLAGQVAVLEGGPTLAGVMVSRGLVDELFVTLSPRVISGDSSRIVHGPPADATPWRLRHGFVDDDGFLFLRYACPTRR